MATLCVLGSNSGRNAGDAAILSSIIHNTLEQAPGTRFEVPAPRKRNISDRYAPDVVRGVPMMPWNLSLRFIGWTTACSIKRSDAVLITDGIIFDVKLLNPIFNFLILLVFVVPLARLFRKPVICFLVGIGPLDSRLGRKCARFVCDRCDAIWVRENDSKTLLESVGIASERIEVYADAAFVDPPAGEERVDEILKENGLADSEQPLIGINVNSYVDQWLKKSEGIDGTQFAAELAKAVDLLIEEEDCRVVLVVTQIMDIAYAEGILEQVNRRECVAVLDNGRYSSEELMGTMGRMRYFVGMRLHSLILAAAMDVPCIGLAYAPKVRHFMDLMGTPESLIELADFSAAGLLAQVQRLSVNDGALRPAWTTRVATLKEQARAGYQALAERYLNHESH